MKQSKRHKGYSLFGASAIGAALMLAPAVHAEEKIKLKMADWMPLSHYTVENAAKPFMNKVTELSRGNIEIQYFPAEQLGKAKDILGLVQSGVVDIADISPAYITEKFPMSGVAELPAMFKTSCEGTYAYASLVKDGGILASQEFKPNGVRVLVSIAYAPYKVLTVNKPIATVKDFVGVKLRTAGGAMDLTTNKLNAISVRMPGPDVLPSLSRGTLDGALFPLQSVKVFDLQTAAKHMTTDVSLGSFITVYAISEKTWSRLPADARAALTTAGQYATKHHCEYVDNAEPKVIAQLERDGVKANRMAPGELAALENALKPVQTEWATTMDKRNKPGTAVLNDFIKALAQ